MENPVSKQCRPWSDITSCGVWSGSALFAYDPFNGFQSKNGLSKRCRKHMNALKLLSIKLGGWHAYTFVHNCQENTSSKVKSSKEKSYTTI